MMDSRIKTEIMDEIMEIGASMEDMGLVNTHLRETFPLRTGICFT